MVLGGGGDTVFRTSVIVDDAGSDYNKIKRKSHHTLRHAHGLDLPLSLPLHSGFFPAEGPQDDLSSSATLVR